MVKLTPLISFFLISIFHATAHSQTLLFVTLSSPPAEYKEDGEIKGRNIDIVKEACKRAGYDFEIRFLPWKRALHLVEKGYADGIIDAAYSKERAKYLHYPAEPIYVEKWYGFKRKHNPLTLDENIANAADIRLGSSQGFIYGGIIQEAIQHKRFKSIEEVASNELNIKKLIAGRFDMFTGVRLTILSLANQMGYEDQIDIVKKSGSNENFLLSSSPTFLAFSKKTTEQGLVDTFSKIFADMKKDGTFQRIEEKYIN